MASDPRIDRIVVLMLENRSLDHMLGFLKAEIPALDGLTGSESNPEDCASPGSPAVEVSADAQYVTKPDGGHELVDVNVQLFCTKKPPAGAVAKLDGFVRSYTEQAKGDLSKGREVMHCFAPLKLPALATLAREFAVCDAWFSSVPGPTWPNRFFAHAATSDGVPLMGLKYYLRDYPMPTLYERLEGVGRDWRIYFHDIPQSLALSRLRKLKYRKNFRRFSASFAKDAAAGDLPAYTFIEPRYFNFFSSTANDQHPPHDVRLGEHLIADVYDALRSSKLWEKTLLVVTYDEHGGLYDHVAPPEVANPDGKTWPDPPFDFRRAGLRVPAVLVSPYVPRGTIDSTPYEHASLAATARDLFGFAKPLTERDRQAKPISRQGWLAKPRKDAPAKLPRPAGAAPVAFLASDEQGVRAAVKARTASTEKLTELQISLVELSNQLAPTPTLRALAAARPARTEHDGAVQVRMMMDLFLGPAAGPAPPAGSRKRSAKKPAAKKPPRTAKPAERAATKRAKAAGPRTKRPARPRRKG